MSGSFRSCSDDNGNFQFDLVENLNDACEACEQMFFMVWWLAGLDPNRVSDAEDAYYSRLNPDYYSVKEKLGVKEIPPPPVDYMEKGFTS